jgi:periplasmic mercuric ion binding protein
MAMKDRLTVALIALLGLAPLTAQAAEQTVVLNVHHANCALCGPIVKTALERVNGVKAVTVSQADAMADVVAKVTFDDSAASVPTLIAATTNAGYPADLAK